MGLHFRVVGDRETLAKQSLVMNPVGGTLKSRPANPLPFGLGVFRVQ